MFNDFFEVLKEKLHDVNLNTNSSLYTHMKKYAYSDKYSPIFNLPLSTKENNIIFSNALEHIMADVLELSAGNTREANKTETRPKDIKMSIKCKSLCLY